MKCPNCGSTEITKEILFGCKTGDLICNPCHYSGYPTDFYQKEEKSDQKNLEETKN